MARKQNVVIENTSIDKLETFLQKYFKQLIMAIAAIIVVFIASYAGYSIYNSSKVKKENLVGQSELFLDTPAGIESFQSLSSSVSFLKGYISVRAGEAWVLEGNKELALKELTI